MLISTHILSEVMSVADRVILINSGRLIFDGKPADLLADGSPEETFYRLTRSAAAQEDGGGAGAAKRAAGKPAAMTRP